MKTPSELFYECATEMLRIIEGDTRLTRREVQEIHDSALAVQLYAKGRMEFMDTTARLHRHEAEVQHDPAV